MRALLAVCAAATCALACGEDEVALDASARVDGGRAAIDAAAIDAAQLDGGDLRDADPSADARADADAGGAPATFTLSGRVTYDYVPAADDDEGGTRLDYTRQAPRPARRILVRAVDGTTILGTARTLDDGTFALAVPRGRTVRVRAEAHLLSDGEVPDGRAPDRCRGATWDAEVVDNTRSRAPYTLASDATYADAAANVTIHAALVRQRGAYTVRGAAPFAILDTVLEVFELVCGAEPAVRLPRLALNWSPNNRPVSGMLTAGEIGTSFHRAASSGSNIYILGAEDVDTDEFDDHVIAHELGHYLDAWLYRSDSGGGGHLDRDVLEPAVAFAEGWSNALSAMALGDTVYVDTKGADQEGGFDTDISAAPRGDDRGVYSENSAQYVMWQLFERRDAAPVSGQYDRIHDTLRRGQKETLALTSVLSFAAHYHSAYGPLAEDLRAVWDTGLDSPYDALCLGACVGVGDPADPFDSDDDLGQYYGVTAPRHYPDVDGVLWPRAFWTVHAPLRPGQNAATAHDQTRFGNYSSFGNKWGTNRYYRYRATRSGNAQISIGSLAGARCDEDVLDLYVYRAGALLDEDESTSGCPSVDVAVRAGETLVVQVQGLGREVDGWVTTVSERKTQGAVVAALTAKGAMVEGGWVDATLTARRARGEDRALSVRWRGVDGVVVDDGAGAWRPLRASTGGEATVTERVRVPAGARGLVVADVRVGDGPSTVAALIVGAPGAKLRDRSVGALVDGVIALP